MSAPALAPGEAHYVFRVTFRLVPQHSHVSPAAFETTVYRPAGEPGVGDDWLFFRDNCWKGAASDPDHLRGLAERELGVPVEHVAFRELRTTEGYYEALRAAITAELDAVPPTFGNADDAATVVKNYLGSSVHVVPASGEGT